jgi:hypothetical protein
VKAKTDLIWGIIEYFQEARIEDDSCQDTKKWSDRVLSYNDVEIILYEMLERIDPKSSRTTGPQVFTREDMEKAYKEGGGAIIDNMNQVHALTFDEYMNINYPNK